MDAAAPLTSTVCFANSQKEVIALLTVVENHALGLGFQAHVQASHSLKVTLARTRKTQLVIYGPGLQVALLCVKVQVALRARPTMVACRLQMASAATTAQKSWMDFATVAVEVPIPPLAALIAGAVLLRPSYYHQLARMRAEIGDVGQVTCTMGACR
mmetsp:Transcript_153011/g.264896  ORF Transcript_153011/g.264896 Transcript_153011/m.264896 type:complete len:157 (+) Transcript_153011:261-731(+)